jgi:hypothetical protein
VSKTPTAAQSGGDLNMEPLSEFVRNEVVKQEKLHFLVTILICSVAYILITFWLNSVRANASLWLVWPLIAVQLLLYLSIFLTCFRRSKEMGLNATVALVGFIGLGLLGRINDWEIFVIPAMVVIMLAMSARSDSISP